MEIAVPDRNPAAVVRIDPDPASVTARGMGAVEFEAIGREARGRCAHDPDPFVILDDAVGVEDRATRSRTANRDIRTGPSADVARVRAGIDDDQVSCLSGRGGGSNGRVGLPRADGKSRPFRWRMQQAQAEGRADQREKDGG